MKFDRKELALLNGLSGDLQPVGFSFRFSRDEETDACYEAVCKSMQKKGILQNRQEMSEKGFLAAQALEQYKQAEDILVINHVYIALRPQKKGDCIVIYRQGEEYEMTHMQTGRIFLFLLRKYPFLCEADDSQKELPSWLYKEEPLSRQAARQVLSGKPDMLSVGCYYRGKAASEYVLQKEKKAIMLSNLGNETRKMIRPSEARMMLLSHLRLYDWKRVKEGGRIDG